MAADGIGRIPSAPSPPNTAPLGGERHLRTRGFFVEAARHVRAVDVLRTRLTRPIRKCQAPKNPLNQSPEPADSGWKTGSTHASGRVDSKKVPLRMQYFAGTSVYYSMEATTTLDSALLEQDRTITATILREGARLRSFVRRRVEDPGEVEDILQDVFFELLEASRLLQPIEQVGAWLFRVARNRIIDRFRRTSNAPTPLEELRSPQQDEAWSLEDLLPAEDGGPDAHYARRVLLDELDAALEELSSVQRDVFIAHELEGRSFQELARQTGLSINTLLARKRYAVLHLRKRLQAIHREFSTNEG